MAAASITTMLLHPSVGAATDFAVATLGPIAMLVAVVAVAAEISCGGGAAGGSSAFSVTGLSVVMGVASSIAGEMRGASSFAISPTLVPISVMVAGRALLAPNLAWLFFVQVMEAWLLGEDRFRAAFLLCVLWIAFADELAIIPLLYAAYGTLRGAE